MDTGPVCSRPERPGAVSRHMTKCVWQCEGTQRNVRVRQAQTVGPAHGAQQQAFTRGRFAEMLVPQRVPQRQSQVMETPQALTEMPRNPMATASHAGNVECRKQYMSRTLAQVCCMRRAGVATMQPRPARPRNSNARCSGVARTIRGVPAGKEEAYGGKGGSSV